MLIPTEYFLSQETTSADQEEAAPRSSERHMCLFTLLVYAAVMTCFGWLVLYGLGRRELVERVKNTDTVRPARTHQGLNFLWKPRKGRRHCGMLLRTSESFEFSRTAALAGQKYEYFLANVKEIERQCRADLQTAPAACAETALVQTTSSLHTRLSQPRGMATFGDLVFTYTKTDAVIWRYDAKKGTFAEHAIAPRLIPPTLYQGLCAADGKLYLVCSGDDKMGKDDEQCGLLRMDATASPRLVSMERVTPYLGHLPSDCAASVDGAIYIPDQRTVWSYDGRRDFINVSIPSLIAPYKMDISIDHTAWIIDAEGPALWHCSSVAATRIDNCSLVADGPDMDGAVDVAVAGEDCYVIYDGRVRLIRFNRDGSWTEVAGGPEVSQTGGPVALASAGSTLYLATEEDRTTISKIDVDESDPKAEVIYDYTITAGWFFCDNRPVSDPDLYVTLADMTSYARINDSCRRGGLAFHATYTLYFADNISAGLRAVEMARSDCLSLDAPNVICTEVAHQPPYLCSYYRIEPGFEVLSVAIANSELLAILLIYIAAVFVTCWSVFSPNYYYHRDQNDTDDGSASTNRRFNACYRLESNSRVDLTTGSPVAILNSAWSDQGEGDLEARVRLLEEHFLKVFTENRQSDESIFAPSSPESDADAVHISVMADTPH